MNELDRVVRNANERNESGLYATSGTSQVEMASQPRWLPHEHRPVVGFTPNT